MATNYPGSLDGSTEQPSPSSTTEMDDAGFEHDAVHTNHSGAIIALETKVGTGDSNAVANSVLAGTGAGTSSWTTGTLANDISGNAATATSATSATTATTATNLSGGSVAATTLTASGDANFDSGTLFVDVSANRVGIGETSPGALLHVNAGNVNLGLLVESTDAGAIIGLKDNNTSGNAYVGIRADGDDLKLRAGNSNRVTVTSGGVLQWAVSSGIGGPLTDTSTTSGYRYVLQNQTFGTFYDYTSIRDRKDQITNVTAEDSGRWIDALQPVTYIERWMGEGDEPDDARTWREADMQVGFIADDILANDDTDHFSQVLDNGEGGLDPAGWKWECVIAAAVAEIKSLRARVAALEAE